MFSIVNYPELKLELENDPENIGYTDLLFEANDEAIANLLNLKNISGKRKLYVWEVKAHAIQNNYWLAIKMAALSHADANVQGAAIIALDYITDLRFETIDIFDAVSSQLFFLLTNGNVMTSNQKISLEALADTLLSRAEVLFGQGSFITKIDVGANR